MYSVPRTILPHGASFNGHPVTIHITYESTKDTFTLEVLYDFFLFNGDILVLIYVSSPEEIALLCLCLCVPQTHSNETIGSIRWKISEHLSCPVDNVQIFANDSVVSVDDSVNDRLCVPLLFLKVLFFMCHSLIKVLYSSPSHVFPLKPVHFTNDK